MRDLISCCSVVSSTLSALAAFSVVLTRSAFASSYLSSGNIANNLPVTFPDFIGRVDYDPVEGRHMVYGKYHKKTKTVMMITEVPYGFDRETYVKVLDKLEDDGDIVSYEDLCDKTGFSFEIKLKQNTSASWNDAKIISKIF